MILCPLMFIPGTLVSSTLPLSHKLYFKGLAEDLHCSDVYEKMFLKRIISLW